jgi:hypothetical protein
MKEPNKDDLAEMAARAWADPEEFELFLNHCQTPYARIDRLYGRYQQWCEKRSQPARITEEEFVTQLMKQQPKAFRCAPFLVNVALRRDSEPSC